MVRRLKFKLQYDSRIITFVYRITFCLYNLLSVNPKKIKCYIFFKLNAPKPKLCNY